MMRSAPRELFMGDAFLRKIFVDGKFPIPPFSTLEADFPVRTKHIERHETKSSTRLSNYKRGREISR
jgi:hypothetical protein